MAYRAICWSCVIGEYIGLGLLLVPEMKVLLLLLQSFPHTSIAVHMATRFHLVWNTNRVHTTNRTSIKNPKRERECKKLKAWEMSNWWAHFHSSDNTIKRNFPLDNNICVRMWLTHQALLWLVSYHSLIWIEWILANSFEANVIRDVVMEVRSAYWYSMSDIVEAITKLDNMEIQLPMSQTNKIDIPPPRGQ